MDGTLRRPDRLTSIEMLRGGAALAVVVYHATGRDLLASAADSPWLAAIAFPASFGFSGVFLFFVISGFCIHLSWARQESRTGGASTDFLAFWKKRIRRLYPAYLAALSLYLLALSMEGVGFSPARPMGWDVGLHLLMLHNLDPATSLTINGVFWTLAVEEQLYLAYFLLLALRRSLGWFATLGICLATRVGWFGLAFIAHRLLGIDIVLQEAAAVHWFVWALGAWSVEAWFGLVIRPRWVSRPWLAISLLMCASGLSLASKVITPGSMVNDLIWLVNDPLWGLGFFVLLNRVTMTESGEVSAGPDHTPWVPAWAASALRRVGLFSYSLYLIHELVLSDLHRVLSARFAMDAPTAAMVQLFILTPLALLGAWMFFLLFERPFLSRTATAPATA